METLENQETIMQQIIAESAGWSGYIQTVEDWQNWSADVVQLLEKIQAHIEGREYASDGDFWSDIRGLVYRWNCLKSRAMPGTEIN